MDDPPVWVVDTNVLVSGFLSPFGPPGRLLDMLQARGLRLATDDRIEAEYRDVLARSKSASSGSGGTHSWPLEGEGGGARHAGDS